MNLPLPTSTEAKDNYTTASLGKNRFVGQNVRVLPNSDIDVTMPRIGTLWIWRGNNYDVVDVTPLWGRDDDFESTVIELREHGADHFDTNGEYTGYTPLYQRFNPKNGTWSDLRKLGNSLT